MKKITLFKSLILASLCFSLILVSCDDGSSNTDNTDIDYTVAEGKLRSDYNQYNIGAINWSTQRGYQIGKFNATPIQRSQSSTSITAWYSVSGETATRKMDSEDLGTTVPASIQEAFTATKYSNNTLWKIDEIELEHNYDTNPSTSYYEMELDGIGVNSNLEAELYFSTEPTGTLLYSKEKLDDDDDSDDDKFVITSQLKAAVEEVASGATILAAEVDDNMIEVEAIITTVSPPKEIELKFTMAYVLVSSETETEYTYNTLPPDFDVVKNWFVANPSTPAPPTNTEVEITEGNQTETDHSIGSYYYEVEIDDYGVPEYEVEFYLSKSKDIIAVIVDDIKQ